MKKNIPVLLLLFIGLVAVQAQKIDFYDAYVSNRMDLWKYHMDKMEKEYETDKSYDVLLELTIVQY